MCIQAKESPEQVHWTLVRLYVGVGILLTRGKHLNDRTISLKREIWTNNTSLTLPHFIVSACTKPGK